jgi:plasmid stabilization system protein ParE
MSVSFHPDARAEADAAADRYARRSPTRAVAFHAELIDAVADIRAQPRLYPPADDAPPGVEVRNLVLRRSPYRVVYTFAGDDIVILAVAHLRRRPGYWRDRLTSNDNP